MPSQYSILESQNLNLVEDKDRFEKLQLWLTNLEARQFPIWNAYDGLFSEIPWKPNMGTTMRGVRAENAPIGRAEFFPRTLQEPPRKDVYSYLETTEDTQLQWHDFDSNLIVFHGSFQDFRLDQIRFQHDDIVRQMSVANDFFIRSFIFQKAPYVYVSGNKESSEGNLIPAPTVPSGTLVNEDTKAKTTEWLQAIAAKIGGNLSLAAVDNVNAIMRDDIGAPFFTGPTTVGSPPENSLLQGRYAYIGSSEAFQQFKWDPHFNSFRNVNLNVITEGFRGSIFDEITYRVEKFPLRFKDDGTFPPPEIIDNTDNRTRPNPEYTQAPNEIGFLLGDQGFRTLRVGPPPSEFRNRNMSTGKFFSMRWNGEVNLTDQVIVDYADGNRDLNNRGRFVKFISSVTYGIVPVRQSNVLPVIFRRQRPGQGISFAA